ncbi:hypothetical protein BGX21_008057 [Mortierella sp. AD011]|nr:hypothetical protein BGX20_011334 [Mortierella sp. AD010]KAF9398213.1 hypothetical protein BGX21_008057 [Mortierella sp. AD011]
MNRYPTDHQRTTSSNSNNNNPYNYNYNNANINNSNNSSYGQFQEGHPVYADNTDWNQLRDSTKQSTSSLSSFKSWTSEDPAYSTQTNSFSSAYSLAKQSRPTNGPPRGESLPNSSGARTSGRYRSNSNANQYNNGYDSNHTSYMSQSSVNSQSYGDQAYHNQRRISGQQQHQHQESRSSHRAHRRRDPSAGDDPSLPTLDEYEAMLTEMTSPKLEPKGRGEASRPVERSLDDFEAMLQEMTSPTMGPKESRSAAAAASSANRRQEREPRESRSERAARPTRRPQPKPREERQYPDQQQQNESRPVEGNNTGASLEVEESFDQKKLRRRSSLPSKLKEAPNLFANAKRLSTDSPITPKSESPRILAPLKEDVDNFQQQKKRFSWENESIAPRVDLLEANKVRPGSLQRKNSWQDLGDAPGHQMQHNTGPINSLVPEHASITPVASEAPTINSTNKPKKANAVAPPPGRPMTPNSRSRPSTPIGGIRPPPGPAPPSATGPPRTASPLPGKRSNSNNSNSGSMLQPPQGSRPRAGSSASVNSLNGFALDRALTPPPPPTQPLPSLPPPPSHPPYQTPPSSQSIPIISGVQPPQNALHGDGQSTLPTPAPSLPMSPELDAVSVSSPAAANQAAHLARLKKRVSLLEKELANAEMEISTRIRDETELQSKVEKLTAERDSLENLRSEIAEKDLEISALKAEQETRLTNSQAILEQELTEAREEIRQLRDLASDRDYERVREEMEHQVKTLLIENEQYKTNHAAMEREIETLQERLQQEAVQYHTLQDSVQRMSSKIARLESQHAGELQQLRMDHDEVLERTLQEHEGAMRDLMENHRTDTDSLLEHAQRQTEDSFRQERIEAEAREKVLRDKIEEQNSANYQFEEQIFQLQNALEEAMNEKSKLERTNRSLERHISMQHLQEQEKTYTIEELQAENANLREVLSDLDIAAATKGKIRMKETGAEGVSEGEDEDEEQKQLNATETFKQQQRKWNEQTQLMARKLARAQEEARKTTEQNESLRIALQLAQSQPSKQQSSPTTSSRVLSPPLSA